MNAQEKIREGIAERIWRKELGYRTSPFRDANPIIRKEYLIKADEWLLYLHSEGLVIMTGEIPSIFDIKDNAIPVFEYRNRLAGLFEPLIEKQSYTDPTDVILKSLSNKPRDTSW